MTMPPPFHRILATTALCLAAVGLNSCNSTSRAKYTPVLLADTAQAESANTPCRSLSVDEQKHIYTFYFVLRDGDTPIGFLAIPVQEIVKNEMLTGISVLSPTFILEREYENLRFVFSSFETAIRKNGTYRGDIDVTLKILPTEENAGIVIHSFGFVYEKGKNGQLLMRTSADNVPFNVPEKILSSKTSIWPREISLQFFSLEN